MTGRFSRLAFLRRTGKLLLRHQDMGVVFQTRLPSGLRGRLVDDVLRICSSRPLVVEGSAAPPS